jgi:putative hemolysin
MKPAALLRPSVLPSSPSCAPGRPSPHGGVALQAVWARDEADVRAAQRLRWRVFADALGAALPAPTGSTPGHDADGFDAHCEHLLVRTVPSDDELSQVVGTYRVLTAEGARRAGGWYSDTEFDMSALASLREGMVELGRSCVDPDFRSGGVILTLWASLAQFMLRHRVSSVIGCASIPMPDGGINAAGIWHELKSTHLAPSPLRARPLVPLPVDGLPEATAVEVPPLIKGYLRCGAKVLGPPAWDPSFSCADLPLLLRWDDLSPSYRRHFATA